MWAQRAWRVRLPSGMGRSKLENAAGVGQVCSQRIIKRTGGSGPPNKGACHALLAPALSGSSPLSRELAGLVRQRLRSHYLPTAFFVGLFPVRPSPTTWRSCSKSGRQQALTQQRAQHGRRRPLCKTCRLQSRQQSFTAQAAWSPRSCACGAMEVEAVEAWAMEAWTVAAGSPL